MRCPSCGTENEPDSRFCGGCGARLAGALPPTQKIDTGARPIQPAPAQPVAQFVRAPTSQPPRTISAQENVPPASYPLAPSVNRPPSGERPPAVEHPPASPPYGSNGAQPASARSLEPTSQRRAPAPSVPPPLSPKRNVALIVIVLIVDLALAGAGAYMLAEGLGEPAAGDATRTGPSAPSGSLSPSPSTSPATSPSQAPSQPPSTSAALGEPRGSAPAPATPPPDSGSTSVAAGSPPSTDAAVTPRSGDAAAARSDPGSGEAPLAAGSAADPEKPAVKSRKKKRRSTTKTPVDPYDEGPPLGIPPARPEPDPS